MIYVAAACIGGGLGCLAHVAARRMSGDRVLGAITGALIGFGVTVLIMYAAGVL